MCSGPRLGAYSYVTAAGIRPGHNLVVLFAPNFRVFAPGYLETEDREHPFVWLLLDTARSYR